MYILGGSSWPAQTYYGVWWHLDLDTLILTVNPPHGGALPTMRAFDGTTMYTKTKFFFFSGYFKNIAKEYVFTNDVWMWDFGIYLKKFR